MSILSCSGCGSSELKVSDFQRKDFPSQLCFVQCKVCGRNLGVVDFYNIQDLMRRKSGDDKKFVKALSETL